MQWSVDHFETWFRTYYLSDEAKARVRSIAVKRGLGDLVDDLYSEGFLSLQTTIERRRRHGEQLPDWLQDEEAARRYVWRALDNDALDLARQIGRCPRTFSDLGDDDGRPFELADESPDAVAAAGEVELHDALDRMVADLNRRVALLDGRANAPERLAMNVCLGVIELTRSTEGADGLMAGLRGGTTDWDRLVYAALVRVAPDQTWIDRGRVTTAGRQAKRRVEGRVRKILQDLGWSHLVDPGGPA